MIDNPFVKKIVQGILRNRKQSLLDRSIMHPYREWFSGLVIGIFILGLAVSWGMSTYIQFSNVSVVEVSVEQENLVYKESLVEKALINFAERRNEYETLKQSLLSEQRVLEEVVLLPVVEIGTTPPEVVSEPEMSTPMPEGSVEGESGVVELGI